MLRTIYAFTTVVVFGIVLCHSARAADITWNGSVGSAWGSAGNWTPGSIPGSGDQATLTGGNNPSIDLGGGSRTIQSLTFAAGSTANFSLNSGSLTLGAGGSIVQATSANRAFTLNVPLTLTGDATFTGNTTAQAPTLTNSLVIAGPLTGAGTLAITGGADFLGNVVLSGNNAGFTGNIRVQSGTLIPTTSQSFGTSATVTMAGGQIFFGAGANTPINYTIAAGGGTWNSYGGNSQSGNVQVDPGATWTIANGGGNSLGLTGTISGSGSIVMPYANTTIGGSTSNTFSGTLTLSANSNTAQYNKLMLNKSGGATAIAGNVVVQNRGNIVWEASNQIADSSTMTMSGGTLGINGKSESLGAFILAGKAAIDVSGGGSLLFADSSAANWNAGKQILIQNWQNAASARIGFGSTANGLTSAQVAKIGFSNPANQPAGLYRATITATGDLAPTTDAVVPINPAFDLSPAAQAARTAVYSVPGRANLSGTGTPLTTGTRISFFGDSLTWLNGYVSNIRASLNAGAGTQGKGIQLFNHGINGGGVGEIRLGSPNNAFDGGTNNAAQGSFASVIAADQSDIAVVFIGVNDVVFKGTTANSYQTQLRQIVDTGQASGVKMVLATVFAYGELPDESNSKDVQMAQFAQITRDVATSTGATLVDLRTAFLDYERNNNWTLQLDGSLEYQSQGILTYDGLHGSALGNELLADQIAQGIFQAASPITVPEPGLCGAVLMGICAYGGYRARKRATVAKL